MYKVSVPVINNKLKRMGREKIIEEIQAMDGERVFLSVDAFFGGETMYRSYARSLQLKNAIGSFGCGRLPAYSYGNPDLYIMAKRNENGMAVGLWNVFADYISEPAVELDREYKRIHFINCDGRLEGNRVYLSKMQPFAFAGFTVE